MRSFWFDPYLWVHLAGVAALPIALELCLVGLAVGDPFLPSGLELLLVAAVGIVPVFWMQWQRPFYIFSLLAVALKPEQLTLTQRQLLHRFKAPGTRGLAVLVAGVLAIGLWQLYRLAPLAVEAASWIPPYRGYGLLLAAIGFFTANLFLQVPVSVLSVMLASDAAVEATEAYPLERVAQDFTLVGLRVKQILPQPVPIASIAASVPQPPPNVEPPLAGASVASAAEIEPTQNAVDEKIANENLVSESPDRSEASVINPEAVDGNPEAVVVAESAVESVANPGNSEESATDADADADSIAPQVETLEIETAESSGSSG